MSKSKFRLVVAALVVFSLFATACFTIIGFKLKKPSLAIGQNNQIIVDLGRQASSSDSVAYSFVLVGVSGNLDLNGTSKFDFHRNFGGRFDSVNHTALRDVLLADDNCGVGGFTATDAEASFSTWKAFRSTVEIASTAGAFGETNRVKVKVARNGGDNSGYGSFVVFAGSWNDDGDLIADAGEYTCTGVISGSIAFKP